MNKFKQDELNEVIGKKIGELRALPEFTGIYITETEELGAQAVVQLHPVTEEAKQKVRDLFPECPLAFRNIGIGKAF